jgi:hypothetical protein
MDIGAIINNQYEVIEHIGRGGMADVWSARDQRLRRMVAIKTIAAGLSADVDPVTLFKTEAQTIAQMEHPHILPIYDFGEYDTSLYIVMRYVTGGSLEGELQNGPMEMDEVLRLGNAVAQALDYAHSNNVIHLDLKPPNILLDSSGAPYLADFGLATVLDKQGRARNPGSGTLLYMAPEQMTSETIDHRADIYAFSIMIFHMLTGQLPFDGRVPLAMRQLQAGDTLPYLDEINDRVPHEVNVVLRKGSAQDPYNRYATHTEMMDELRKIVRPSNPLWTATAPIPDLEPYQLETQRVETSDAGLLEAVDLYSRARYNWQGGQGRFLLGVTHFMLMSGYYQDAAFYGLEIDHEGYQMLLRGAIEYDYELEYWWNQVNDADRRWVCLHALRSGNAPARIRALYRLETLPDDESNPAIPRLVAQALEIEVDNTAKLAALKVLGTRAKLVKRPTMSIMTEFRGRLLTSFTRMGIQIAETGQWQEAVYSPEVDTLVAEQAFDENETVAEFAARTVGKMRSLAGVSYLAEAQVNNRHGSLEALAFVRDEAPALPDVVSRQARFYAWITNTVRRLTDKPLQGILRFALALLGGWIAMGEYVNNTFRSEVFFDGQRWGNMLGIGLTFGLFIGVTYFAADELPRRLKGFWLWWQRLLVFGVMGLFLGVMSYGGFTWLYYQYDPIWDVIRLGGYGLAFGLILASLLQVRGWQAVIFITVMAFAPILLAHNAFSHRDTSTIVAVAPFGLFVGLFAGYYVSSISPLNTRLRLPESAGLHYLISALVGVVWAVAVWFYLMTTHDRILAGQQMTWDAVIWLFLGMFLLGMIVAYALGKIRPILVVAAVATLAFAVIYGIVSWEFFDYRLTVPFLTTQPAANFVYLTGEALTPLAEQPIFHFDVENPNWVYTVALPMVFTIALFVNLQPLYAGLLGWIGAPESGKIRDGWLTSVLIYALSLTGLASVLALFSAKESVIWALGWSLWSFITFVFALAAFRWARWGANGLIASTISFVFGGFLFDAVNMRYQISQGDVPALLRSFPIDLPLTDWTPVLSALVFWGLWSVVLGFFVWGTLRRYLWAGIGLVTMLVGWYAVAIFSPIQGSMTVFAVTNVTLLLFALMPAYSEMETGRFTMPRLFAAQTVDKPKRADTKPAGTPTDRPPVRKQSVARNVPPISTPEMATKVDVDTEHIHPDISLTDMQTEELNRLLAASDVNAANFAMGDNDGENETQLDVKGAIDIDTLNRLLAESDVNAAKFTYDDDEPDEYETQLDVKGAIDIDTLNRLLAESDVNAAVDEDEAEEDAVSAPALDIETLNRMLAESDVNAAKFKFDEDEELSDSQLQPSIMFPRENPLSAGNPPVKNTVEEGDMPEKTNSDEPYLKDATNLQTEPIPGGHKLSDGSGLTTEDIPKVKTPEEKSDNENE